MASASAALVLPAAPAQAQPKPSLKDAKAKLQQLNSQFDHQDNAYNKAKQEREAAQKKLAALNKSVAADQQTYEQLRERVAQLAVSAYKNGGEQGDIPALVSAKNPADVLDQISMFAAVTKNRSTEVGQFLTAAQLLQRQRAEAQQAAQDLAQKAKDEKSQRDSLKKKASEQQALVNKLGGGSTGGGPVGGTYNGPASGNARKALQYAYAQLGKPYVYGGTGPSGYDCSGLVMMAWRSAGVDLPRVVPDQYNATRRVSKADLQPGDLVFFDSLGHVGLYVGGGKFIHAPHTGTTVQIESLSGYYSSNYVGAGRP